MANLTARLLSEDFEEALRELEALKVKATQTPWFLNCEPTESAESAQCVVFAEEDELGKELFDTFNRGYKVSEIMEEADEDGRRFYDIAGEKDLKYVVELVNADPLAAIRELHARLRTAKTEGAAEAYEAMPCTCQCIRAPWLMSAAALESGASMERKICVRCQRLNDVRAAIDAARAGGGK